MGSDYYDGYPVCDTAGRYVVAIQRINFGALNGAVNSAVDGYYGSGTQQDVRNFQGLYGLRQDGLVGSTTWSRYDNYLSDPKCFMGPDCYWKIPDYDSNTYIFRQISGPSSNWDIREIGYSGWDVFDRYGP